MKKRFNAQVIYMPMRAATNFHMMIQARLNTARPKGTTNIHIVTLINR